jgi:hypothetical protein
MSNLTKRDYLASLGLAKAGVVGRFSKDALAALAKAEAEGMTFALTASEAAAAERAAKAAAKAASKPAVVTPAPAAPKPAVSLVKAPAPTQTVIPKEVRSWAAANGYKVGERGRIDGKVVAAYLAAEGGNTGQSAPAVRRPTPLDMPKVRTQSVGWGLVPPTARLGIPQRSILVGTETCGKGHRLTVCPCEVPSLGEQWGNTPLSFTKPVA